MTTTETPPPLLSDRWHTCACICVSAVYGYLASFNVITQINYRTSTLFFPVSWFVPQNQVGYDLSVAPQNRREDKDGAGHALRSSGLLRVEVKPKDGRFDDIRCGTVEVR
jgi:hypothetical protein